MEINFKDVERLRKETGASAEDCAQALKDHNNDIYKAFKYLEKYGKKKPKEKKVFKKGDTVICTDNKPSKNMPSECIDFLLTYKFFKVLDVNEKLNIDLGHRLAENGNIYWFAPNRFELKDGKAPTIILGSEEEKPKEADEGAQGTQSSISKEKAWKIMKQKEDEWKVKTSKFKSPADPDWDFELMK